jgi:cytochrome P450
MDDVFGTLMAGENRRDPYPVYARYVAERPIVDTGLGLWFVSGYADCLALLRDRRVSVDERLAMNPGPGDELSTLIHLDPPDHTRLRRLVQTAFTPRRVESIRQKAERIVDDVLMKLSVGDEIDVIADLAYPMPLAIICDLLGVAESDRSLVRDWSEWLAKSIDPGVLRSPELNNRIQRAQTDFIAFMVDLIAHRRSRPADDLLSQLVSAELDGDRLAEHELIGLAVLLLVAGHETTVNLVGNGLLALLSNRDQLSRVVVGSVDDRRVVDELLRYDSPVQMTTRIALEPIELSCATVPTGHVVVLLLGAANNDPSAFADPRRLDVSLDRATPHLAFGNGIHHCLGAALARAEGEVAITKLVRRFPAMQLVGESEIRPTFVLRGREELRARL